MFRFTHLGPSFPPHLTSKAALLVTMIVNLQWTLVVVLARLLLGSMAMQCRTFDKSAIHGSSIDGCSNTSTSHVTGDLATPFYTKRQVNIVLCRTSVVKVAIMGSSVCRVVTRRPHFR